MPSSVALSHIGVGGDADVAWSHPGSVIASSNADLRSSPTTPSSATTAEASERKQSALETDPPNGDGSGTVAASTKTFITGTASDARHPSSPVHAVVVAHSACDDASSAYGLSGVDSALTSSVPATGGGSPERRQCLSCARTTLVATVAMVASALDAVNAPKTAGSNPADCISHRRWGMSALAPSPRSRTQRTAGGRSAAAAFGFVSKKDSSAQSPGRTS
mmetsp:Transcript_8025/g.22257  ORF Transcript_8025/g.22257 Transcript_8025/m.22257 type:complete len:220 (+) Transcript_8025:2875-3534(+)